MTCVIATDLNKPSYFILKIVIVIGLEIVKPSEFFFEMKQNAVLAINLLLYVMQKSKYK